MWCSIHATTIKSSRLQAMTAFIFGSSMVILRQATSQSKKLMRLRLLGKFNNKMTVTWCISLQSLKECACQSKKRKSQSWLNFHLLFSLLSLLRRLSITWSHLSEHTTIKTAQSFASTTKIKQPRESWHSTTSLVLKIRRVSMSKSKRNLWLLISRMARLSNPQSLMGTMDLVEFTITYCGMQIKAQSSTL